MQSELEQVSAINTGETLQQCCEEHYNKAGLQCRYTGFAVAENYHSERQRSSFKKFLLQLLMNLIYFQ